MTGRIILVGAGELMAAMSGLHRAALSKLPRPARAVFLDTTAGFETNIDAIVEKAVEYYQHHLQTDLGVASYRHRDQTSAGGVAAAIAEIREANLIFAGPGSPSYAIKQWRDSVIWDAVVERFEAGADLFFASAASITLGRYALPVYEVYKAGEDPFWLDGLDLLSRFGVQLAVVPHYNDNSGGENYDSRFCYMGARRFDQLQEVLPADVAILGIDSYTSVTFEPGSDSAQISGQGGVTVIGDGAERRFESGAALPLEALHSSSREVVRTFDESQAVSSYAFSDAQNPNDGDPLAPVLQYVESINGLESYAKIELMARLEGLRGGLDASAADADAPLVDLVLELRAALREAKRYDLADKARDTLTELGYEIGDSPQGATWTRQ